MKIIRYIFSILLALSLLISCEEEKDYSGIVYKNYLTYEIERAQGVLAVSAEGEQEGQYKTGAKEAYQQVIVNAIEVDSLPDPTQTEVDETYAALLQAYTDFRNKMHPYISVTEGLLEYAEYIYSTTAEGSQEGNVPLGKKAELQLAIDSAYSTMAIENLTQTELTLANTYLSNSIILFNSNIIGKAIIGITNAGFELPGTETTDLTTVPGWEVGVRSDWMTNATIVQDTAATEGAFYLKTGSYIEGIYQQLPELIQPGVKYTLSFDVSLLANYPDWKGNSYPAIFLSRFIVFDGDPGYYVLANVISEQYDTLGINPTGFTTITHTLEVSGNANYTGRKIAIDFMQRHGWDAQNPIYAESYVAIDNIQLTRE